MPYSAKSALPLVESSYHQLTSVEKSIADYFLANKAPDDFSARAVSGRLAVSEASLSRFAKKCGFKGYREFIFLYESGLGREEADESMTVASRQVLDSYQQLLTKSVSLVNEEQLARICADFSRYNRAFVAGEGSSGFAAQELAYRFMRIGVDIDAIIDPTIMRMQAYLRSEKDLCIGLSLSGQTETVLDFLRLSHQAGAKTILITANYRESDRQFCDEILLVPSLEHLNYGTLISPQFPLLVMCDLLYGGYLNMDRKRKESLHMQTLQALENHRRQ